MSVAGSPSSGMGGGGGGGVIVKSHEQHTYLEENRTSPQLEFYTNASLFSQVLCPKHENLHVFR